MTVSTRQAAGLLAGAAILAGVAAGAVVAFAVGPNGPGLSVDSASYELAADHYRTAPELVPLVLNGVFPPGYPAAIAAAETWVEPARDAAVLVNQVAIATGLGLAAVAVWRGRREVGEGATSALVGALVAVGLLAIAPSLLRWTGYVMAEVLSIALLLGALVAADLGLRRASLPWLGLAGSAAGLATVVRHGAAGTALAIALVAIVHHRHRSKRRGATAAGVTLGAAAGTWLAASWLLLGERPRSQRELAWHPPGIEDLRQSGETLAAYWMPAGLPVAAATSLIVVGLVAAIWWLARRVGVVRTVPVVAWLAVATGFAHMAVLVMSKAVVDRAIVADDRLLLPLVPLSVIAAASCWPAPRGRLAGVAVTALVMIVAVAQADRTVDWVRQIRGDGIELGQRVFVDSPTLAAVRRLPASTTVWTDQVSLLSLHADRQAFPVPARYDSYSGREAEDFRAEVVDLVRAVESGGVAVVFIETYPDDRLLTAEELLDLRPGLRVARFPDGAIVTSATERP